MTVVLTAEVFQLFIEAAVSTPNRNPPVLLFLIFVHVAFLRVLYNIHHHIVFAEEVE